MRTSLIHSAGRCSARSAWTRASAGLAVVGGTAYCLSTRRNIFLDTAAGEPKQQRSLIKKVSEARISLRDSDREVWQGGQSVEVDTVSGIRRYDVATIASNNPGEDYHAQSVFPVADRYWSLFAIFDGHNGISTSAWLSENLFDALRGSLGDLYSRIKSISTSDEPVIEAVEKTLKQTFKDVDNDIVYESAEKALSSSSRDEAISLLRTAYSGSCATVAFFDSHTHLLHVAATGDSRAVLGRRVAHPDGSGHYYEVRELSVDQNGLNPAEEARLLAQHPGEAVVERGRVLGWGISRAFGNGIFKWDLGLQKRLSDARLTYPPPPTVKTPPYLTAEPEVTTTKIQSGDFMVVASDGLWEWLTCEDAVGLVGWWLDAKAPGPNNTDSGPVDRVLSPKELPVKGDHDPDAVRVRTPRREPRFVNMDGNVASHLIRNALGGADDALRAHVLSFEAPESRRYRDDITVTVVFFA